MISLESLVNRSRASLVGVDVSSTSIMLVELARDKAGNLVLERCAMEPLQAGCVRDGNIENFDEVADVLRRVLKKSGVRTRRLVMALPSSAVISKKLSLPEGLSDTDLQVQVEVGVGKYIPFALDEVFLDFCVLGPSTTTKAEVEVLIAAARREKVQERESLAEAAGFKLVAVDVESYASSRAMTRLVGRLPGKGVDAVVALFEIGSTTTSLQVVKNDEILYERDQTFGGAQLTQLIAKQYDFSYENAEAKKRSADLPEDYAASVLKPFVESMTQEIVKALEFFFTSTPFSQVDHVMLAGGSSALVGLAELVTRQTGFPCKLINPFDEIEISSSGAEGLLKHGASSYLTACGLALRKFEQ